MLQEGIYKQVGQESSKFVPQTSVGVDYMLVSPENDTSKKFSKINNKVLSIQLPFKNINTSDLSTANLSPMQVTASTQVLLMLNFFQMASSYYQSEDGKSEKVKYDFSEAHSALTNFLHSFCSVSKSGRPRGGMLMEILRTRVERSEASISEVIKQSELEKESDKKGWLKGWKK